VLIPAIILFIIPLILDHWLARRRFLRMSAGGVEQFSSYGRMVAATSLEGFVRFLSAMCNLGGLAAFAYWTFNEGGLNVLGSWGESLSKVFAFIFGG
jgi:hypothetical protein